MVQRQTGEDYGLYFVLFNFSMMFNMLLDLGTTNYNNKKVAANESKFGIYFSHLFSLRLVLAVVYLAIVLPVGWLMGYKGEAFTWLVLLGFGQVFLSAIMYFRSNLTGLKLFRWDSLVSITDRIIMCSIILYLIFYAGEKIDISLFIQVQFWGYLLAALLALVLIFWKGGWVKPQWSSKFNFTALKKSYPYALIVVLMSLYSYTDSLMLDQLLADGKFQNMIYAESFRILMAANNYIYLVAVLLLPLFAKLLHQKKEVESLLRLSGTLVIYGTLVFAIFCHVYANEIISLLYGEFPSEFPFSERFTSNNLLLKNKEEVQYSAHVFSVLVLSIIPMSFNYIYGVLLTAGGKMKILNWIATAGIAANVGLNFILIPNYGALGASIASVFTQTICGLAQWHFAYKENKIVFPKLHFIKVIFGMLIFYICCGFLHSKGSDFAMLIVLFFGAFFYIFLIKLIDLKSIKLALKKTS